MALTQIPSRFRHQIHMRNGIEAIDARHVGVPIGTRLLFMEVILQKSPP